MTIRRRSTKFCLKRNDFPKKKIRLPWKIGFPCGLPKLLFPPRSNSYESHAQEKQVERFGYRCMKANASKKSARNA